MEIFFTINVQMEHHLKRIFFPDTFNVVIACNRCIDLIRLQTVNDHKKKKNILIDFFCIDNGILLKFLTLIQDLHETF